VGMPKHFYLVVTSLRDFKI